MLPEVWSGSQAQKNVRSVGLQPIDCRVTLEEVRPRRTRELIKVRGAVLERLVSERERLYAEAKLAEEGE